MVAALKLQRTTTTSRKATALAAEGAISATSIRQLVEKSDVVLSCLPNDQAILNVYQGPEGVLACTNPGSIVIDLSKVSLDTSRMLHGVDRERGIEVLDVAISGSTPAADVPVITGALAQLRDQ